MRLKDGTIGSVTIGGTVSPAGGNFEEPVTQATLKVVGAFHGLSRERSDARRYPAIDPLESWSKYPSIVRGRGMAGSPAHAAAQGSECNQMMKVVGEEGTAIDDFIVYLKGEFLDALSAAGRLRRGGCAPRRPSASGTCSDMLTKILAPDHDVCGQGRGAPLLPGSDADGPRTGTGPAHGQSTEFNGHGDADRHNARGGGAIMQ